MKTIPRHLEAPSRRERSRAAGERENRGPRHARFSRAGVVEPAAEILTLTLTHSEAKGERKGKGLSTIKNVPEHPKLRGEYAETHFLARASEHGLSVSKPYGDCLPYDFIVEHHGRMLRVQVKSTSYQCPGYTGYKCFVKPSPKGKRYPAGALDFIAAYILPEDVWYIIPFGAITSKNTVHLDPRSPRNRYRPYREAWHLLRGQARRIAREEGYISQSGAPAAAGGKRT